MCLCDTRASGMFSITCHVMGWLWSSGMRQATWTYIIHFHSISPRTSPKKWMRALNHNVDNMQIRHERTIASNRPLKGSMVIMWSICLVPPDCMICTKIHYVTRGMSPAASVCIEYGWIGMQTLSIGAQQQRLCWLKAERVPGNTAVWMMGRKWARLQQRGR